MNEKEIIKDKKLLVISIIVALIFGLVITIVGLISQANKISDINAEVEDLQFKLDSADAIYKITSDTAKKYMSDYIDLSAEYKKLESDYALMEKKFNLAMEGVNWNLWYKPGDDASIDEVMAYIARIHAKDVEAEMDEMNANLIEEALKGLLH